MPPSVLNCHWYDKFEPEPTTVKLPLSPAQIVWFVGWVVIEGPEPDSWKSKILLESPSVGVV